MTICKHKKLLAINLRNQFKSGLIVDDVLYSFVPNSTKIFCEKCKEWQTE